MQGSNQHGDEPFWRAAWRRLRSSRSWRSSICLVRESLISIPLLAMRGRIDLSPDAWLEGRAALAARGTKRSSIHYLRRRDFAANSG